jgi:hypothetical protein
MKTSSMTKAAVVEVSLSSSSSSLSSPLSSPLSLRSSSIQNNRGNSNNNNNNNSRLLSMKNSNSKRKNNKGGSSSSTASKTSTNSSNKRSSKRSSKNSKRSILSLRMILAVLATIGVGSTLYYDFNVSSNFQRAIESASSMVTYNTKQSIIIVGGVVESQQPKKLTTQQQTAIQKYEQHDDSSSSSSSSSSSQKWTKDERSNMRQYFRNDIQNSIISNKSINKTNVLFWDVDFKNIYLFLKMRSSNKYNKYKFYNMFPTKTDGSMHVITDS